MMIFAVWGFLTSGGIFMLPLILCSLTGLSFIIFLFIKLKETKIIPSSLLGNLNLVIHDPERLKNDEFHKKFYKMTKESNTVLGKLVELLMEGNFTSRIEANEAMQSKAREQLLESEKVTTWLEVIITIAPLLGLLGTASGLVSIFTGLSLEQKGTYATPTEIAAGISEALNTTIAGLAIAVPCIIAHGFFSRKIEEFSVRLESVITRSIYPITNLYDLSSYWLYQGDESNQSPIPDINKEQK